MPELADKETVCRLYFYFREDVYESGKKKEAKSKGRRCILCCLRMLCQSLSDVGNRSISRSEGYRRSGNMYWLWKVCKGLSCNGNFNTGGDKMKKRWYDYLWIVSLLYLILGFFQILFAWLGLLCFFIPLIIAVVKGNKGYCNRYCGRGQLFEMIGGRFGLSRRKDVPGWMKSKGFRYGFLIFFFVMFFQMLWNTYLVFSGAESLRQVVTLLWIWKLPWNWAYHGVNVSPWAAQFAFGFYSVMLTSTVLGFVTMLLFKPRSWCVYCPMGTMTQLICKGKMRIEKDG